MAAWQAPGLRESSGADGSRSRPSRLPGRALRRCEAAPGPRRRRPRGARRDALHVSPQRDGRLRRHQSDGCGGHPDLRPLSGTIDRSLLGALRHGEPGFGRARLLAVPARDRGAPRADDARPDADRPRAESARVRRRPQDVGLRAFADRLRPAGRRIRLRAVRASRRDHAPDGTLAGRLVDLPRDALLVPGLPALDLGRDRGAVRTDVAVGRSRARSLLLFDRRLVPRRPARADGHLGVCSRSRRSTPRASGCSAAPTRRSGASSRIRRR